MTLDGWSVMFEAVALATIAVLFGTSILSDDEVIKFANTIANMVTVALLIWHQRKIRKEIEPAVKRVEQNTDHLADWDGRDRRGNDEPA